MGYENSNSWPESHLHQFKNANHQICWKFQFLPERSSTSMDISMAFSIPRNSPSIQCPASRQVLPVLGTFELISSRRTKKTQQLEEPGSWFIYFQLDNGLNTLSRQMHPSCRCFMSQGAWLKHVSNCPCIIHWTILGCNFLAHGHIQEIQTDITPSGLDRKWVSLKIGFLRIQTLIMINHHFPDWMATHLIYPIFQTQLGSSLSIGLSKASTEGGGPGLQKQPQFRGNEGWFWWESAVLLGTNPNRKPGGL